MAGWLNQVFGNARQGASATGAGRAATAAPAHGEAKGAVPLVALQSPTAAYFGPRTYHAFARDGMMRNAVVYRCVRLISEAAASVPLSAYDGNNEVDTHPLLDLIARPAPGLTATDFLESWYGYLLVSGNGYMQAVSADGLVGLNLLRPDRVRIASDAQGWPIGYDYTAQGQTRRITGEAVPGVAHVLHLRLFHPDNDHYGLSPLEAAATAVDIHNCASRWNKALLDNAARPSGALVYSAGDHMTSEQFDRLKSELADNFQGAHNAGRPLLLEGGLDWKAMSMSPRDMDFIAAKNAAAREIALALGVPPMLLGIPGDNTYANYQEANRTFWRQTVLPLVNRTVRGISQWLAPAFASPAELRPDLDRVEALSVEREALWRRIDAASFLTPDEKREAVGYGPADATTSQS